jgi:predicted unusual protein kinase regulating ubiquinone biosynthesis (AarF/ABC1/UbiB family)
LISLARVGADAAAGTVSAALGLQPNGEIARGPGARRRQVARLGASVGKTMGTAKLQSIGASESKRERLRRRAAERATNLVVRELGNMKGIAMKLGQLASYAATLSDDAEQRLAVLQATSQPVAFDAIAHVVAEELGSPPDEAFASFDPEPIAAASVGQVHRACTHDGDEVVVKVQYPGVRDAIAADLCNLRELSLIAALGGGKIEFQPLYDEIGTLITRELDYSAEAANQTAFADAYAGHPRVIVPRVLHDLSSRRVLTSEYVAGRTLWDVISLPQEQRDAFGETVYRFALGSLLSGTFSGDPHPGNYLFCDDGRVCFIDFGLVMRLPDPSGLQALAAGALAGDDAAVGRALLALGLLGGDIDATKLWDELRPLVFGPIDDGRVRLSKDAYRDSLRRLQDPSCEMHKLQRSAEAWVAMFVRYAFGTMAVVARLGAQADWHGVLSGVVNGER